MKFKSVAMILLTCFLVMATVGVFFMPTTAGSAQRGTSMELEPPLGLPPVPIPSDNPMTVEKVELGKMLYFDKRLSKDKTLSCATCHIPENGYAEPLKFSKGIKDQLGPINAPPVVNSAYATSMFWDGRMTTLEEQAAGPVGNPIEMGHSIDLVAKELNKVPEYKKRFQAVFGENPTPDNITKAIAAFERTILSGNSKYDKYQAGDKSAMSEDAIAGMKLFQGRALCASCHTPPVFSNWGFYNAGVEVEGDTIPEGRMAVSGNEADKGAFRVPHLRSLSDTGPYLHDGSAETMEDAVRFMATGGKANASLHPLFNAVKAQNLSDQEINQIVEFLKALDGEYPIHEEPELP